MAERIHRGRLKIATCLFNFVEDEAIPGTGIDPALFWSSLDSILSDLAPKNRFLLAKRQTIQEKIDAWHKKRVANPAGTPKNGTETMDDYKAFLMDIGYLVPEGSPFEISTQAVDAEIASVAAPQLIVPVKNARYSLNAVNARWGSLYDALYGSDVISEEDGCQRQKSGLNTKRAKKVIEYARQVLDTAAPLANGASHSAAVRYYVKEGRTLAVELEDGSTAQLASSADLIGYVGDSSENPSAIVIRHNGLHVEIQIDTSRHTTNAGSGIGSTTTAILSSLDAAGLKDVVLESAVTCIQDCEDSVAAVDAEDKVDVYRNWLGLMKGTLEDTFEKDGKRVTRRMNADRVYTAPSAAADNEEGRPHSQQVTLPGRALLLIRHVGHLMTNDAVLMVNNGVEEEVPEGILDCAITALCALHDDALRRQVYCNSSSDSSTGTSRDSGSNNLIKNSRLDPGSMYIVKPKMHGPEEVSLAVELFSRVERALCLPINTLKIGIMDEERRTTVNLKECIRAASQRLIFINTGFLDRTGDEIHTSMEAGAFQTKEAMKTMPWLQAYENWSVDVGLSCGLKGRAQIGKGMWAMPDRMAEMLEKKIAHPQQGATCAWVPSPTAATLHATQYHKVNVFDQQEKLRTREKASIDDILSIPLIQPLYSRPDGTAVPSSVQPLSAEVIQHELDNNAQGMLGYVVRWVDQGVGCSKVPDVNNVGLMEDRATLRISSQHIANWLKHGICSKEQVVQTLCRMAVVVDKQNRHDPAYVPMVTGSAEGVSGEDIIRSMGLAGNVAFQAACSLVFDGYSQPSGYTEPILHSCRRAVKEKQLRVQQQNSESF